MVDDSTCREEGAKRRVFDTEFKREAVRLIVEDHRRTTEVARDLGIEPNLLFWHID